MTDKEEKEQDMSVELTVTIRVREGHIERTIDAINEQLALLASTGDVDDRGDDGWRWHESAESAPVLPQEALEAQLAYLEAQLGRLARETAEKLDRVEKALDYHVTMVHGHGNRRPTF